MLFKSLFRLQWLIYGIMLFGCTIAAPSSPPPQNITTGERVMSESFTNQGNWSNYATDTVTASVTNGVYQMLLRDSSQYIWGSNGAIYDNTVIEVDVAWRSDNPTAFAGVICHLHPDDGRGYYVVVSASGDFSIRYIGRNIDDAIVRWQANSRIPTSGSFRMRVICVDDTIALYINGDYVDAGTDTRLRDGQIGLTVGMPRSTTIGDSAFVEFDNLRVWQASQ